MLAHAEKLSVDTRGDDHIVDITGAIREVVSRSGVETGQVVAMVVGSTASLTTMEFEPGLVEHDLAAALSRIAPQDGYYRHEATWHDDNGHSHVRASLLGPSIALPVVGATVPLGTWQQVVLCDFDTRPRRRSIVVTVVGTGVGAE